jgi:hypothetical protein
MPRFASIPEADRPGGMKKYDKNLAPHGWYVGSYLLRFIEREAKGNFNPGKKFLVWENTVIVKAKNMNQAYDKIVALGKKETTPYKGGPEGVDVQWLFEGITQVLPIYEELKDGAEIMWLEYRGRTLKKIRSWARTKAQVRQ